MKRAFLMFVLLVLVWANTTRAADTGFPVNQFPKITPEYSLWGGMTYVDPSGSPQAGEYEYLESSPSGGGYLMAYPLPSYIYLEGEVKNKNDFFGEARYAYKDLFTGRWITRRIWHNLENIELRDYPPSTPAAGINVQDPATDYGLRTDINQFVVRLKPSTFPFHIYGGGFGIDHDGNKQYRFLGGSGYFNHLRRTSIEREVNDQTRDYKAGFNAHLGPVELDYYHSDLTYKPDGGNVLLYPYDFAGVRSAGIYETGRIPQVSGFGDTLRLHSNYGGRLFAGTTLSRLERTNEFSQASVEYYLLHGEVLWMPLTKLRLVTKFRWQDTDAHQPDGRLDLPAANDSETVRLTLAARYRLMRTSNLTAEFIHEAHERAEQYAREWGLAETVDRNIFRLGIDTRPHRTLQIKAYYTHRDIDEDTRYLALGIVPNSSNEGRLSLVWSPLPRLTGQFQASIARNTKDDLQMLDEAGDPLPEELTRDALAQRIFGSLTWGVRENFWVTPSYTYFKNQIDQDLAYNTWPPAEPIADDRITSSDHAHVAAVNFVYSPQSNLDLEALAVYTCSRGYHDPQPQQAREPIPMASFAELDIKEWALEGRLKYEFTRGISLRCTYRYADYTNDSVANSVDGNYHLFQVALGKKW